MTNKQRIIELVRKNVITMEEALELLEASSQSNESIEENETIQEVAPSTEESITTDEESSAYSLEKLREQLRHKQEDLTIVEQRLRELEIFSELDDLTEEMHQQLDELKGSRIVLEQEIATLQEEINLIERVSSSQETADKIFNEEVSESVKKISEEAKQIGKHTQKVVTDVVKGVFKDFSWDSWNIDTKHFKMNAFWKKSIDVPFEERVEVDELSDVAIELISGDIDVSSHHEDYVLLTGEACIYGESDESEEFNIYDYITLEIEDGHLRIVFDPMLKDVHVYLPDKQLDKVAIITTSGDIDSEAIQANEFVVCTKSGDVKLKQVHGEVIQVEINSGDVLLQRVDVCDVRIQTMSGDIRVDGVFENLNIDTLSGDILVTQREAKSGEFRLVSMSGDIKVAVPPQSNVNIHTEVVTGEIRHRLSNCQVSDTKQLIERQLVENVSEVTIDTKTKSGDIYYKDHV